MLDKNIDIVKRQATTKPSSVRKTSIRAMADKVASSRTAWISRNQFYYDDHYRYMRFLVPPNSRVLDLGCGIGDLLEALSPAEGVGMDLSSAAIETARAKCPHYDFFIGDIEDPANLEQFFPV